MKERVRTVLNYKKPAFWITIVAIVVCVIIAICFLTNPAKKYQIRITVPAGSNQGFCYSDEEISPKGNTIVLSIGEGLGDCEVVLDAVEVQEENVYEPAYMTPGFPVKMEAEKGAWFKIGVNMQNNTDEDKIVYVNVENVEVRIADIDVAEETEEEVSEWITEEINVEKRDVTHDGVLDYIVTSMEYDPVYIEKDSILQERITQQIMYDVVAVNIYEGQNNSDTYSEENLLWSQEYSRVHVGNGQLSIVQMEGKDYLLASSLYGGQGVATWDYEVFSLKGTGEKEVIDKQSVNFEIGTDDSAESYKEFQSSLNRYINNGILIVACDIDFEEQLIRTQESPYIPQDYYSHAFSKFDNVESLSEEQN